MKKTIKLTFVVLMFFGLLFASRYSYAQCCLPQCSKSPDNKTCNVGTYDPRICSEIDSCKSGTGSQEIAFVNPVGFTSFTDLLNAVLNNLIGVIVTVAVIFIVIGGIMYMTSGGNEAMITRAKKTWTGAIIGLAIALTAPTFLKEIQNILGGASGTGGSAASWVANAPTIRDIAVNILKFLLSIVGIVAMIAMVIGGGTYLTAYGDQRQIDRAKNIIKYAIIGIVVSLAALIIVRQVNDILTKSAADDWDGALSSGQYLDKAEPASAEWDGALSSGQYNDQTEPATTGNAQGMEPMTYDEFREMSPQ